MASEISIAPQLECSVKGASGDHPSISRDVTPGYLVIVPAQSGKRKPGLSSPYFCSAVIAAGHHELPAPVKLDVGDQVGVSWDRVLNVTLSQVPDLYTVVLAGGDNVVPIWAPINTCDSFKMAFKEHGALPCSQVPHSSK